VNGLCSKGCGKPVKIRGYCKGCYQAKRTKWIRAGIWPGMPDAIGTTRRLQALAALGWAPSELARRTGVNRSTIEHLIKGRVQRTALATVKVKAVAAIYEQLSMSQGPSQMWRDTAAKRGWTPPLAWDDDTIDDPDAKPDRGEKRHADWGERFLELRELGYTDFDIAAKLKIRPESMLRQMDRYGIPVDPDFNTFALDKRYRSTAS